jgi:hypothetical protein
MLLKTLPVAMLMLAASCCAIAAAEIDPAQAIAQKFSEASDQKPDAKPAPPAAPVADAPAATKPAAPATTTTTPVAAPVPAPTKPAPVTTAERPSLDYEMDMLRRARAEELERESQDAAAAKKAEDAKKAEVKKAEDAQKAMQTVAAPTPPAVPVAAPSAPAPVALPSVAAPLTAAVPVSPPPVPPAIAPPPVAPATQSAEAVASPPPPPPSQSTPAALPVAELPGIAAPDTSNAPHATILLVLDTDDGGPAKPDPIICLADRCWISNGIEAAAKPMPRSEAVAMKSTDSPDMDSCSGKSACVFRDIAIVPDAQIQVVELGDSHGAGSGAFTVMADASCRKDDGALVCDNALVTHDFRIWMVPEATAQAIGAEGLEDAVAAGLPNDGVEPANDK